MRFIHRLRAAPSRGLRSWLATLLGSAAVLGSTSASAVSFGATATATVNGNCQTEQSSLSNGGSLAASAVATVARTGGTTASCAPFYDPGGWFGTATSSAYLSTGQLRVFASGAGPEANISLFPTGSPVNLSVTAVAQFFDTLRLIPPVGFTGTDALIEVHLDVTRTVAIASGSDPQRNQGLLSWALTTTGLFAGGRTNRCDDDGAITARPGCNGGPIVHRFRVSLANPEIFLQVDMGATSWNNATADASATGTLSFLLPAGFTIQSDSGVLLVPEPARAVLVGIALIGILGSASRRARPR